mgnify:CR=1 FL=1
MGPCGRPELEGGKGGGRGPKVNNPFGAHDGDMISNHNKACVYIYIYMYVCSYIVCHTSSSFSVCCARNKNHLQRSFLTLFDYVETHRGVHQTSLSICKHSGSQNGSLKNCIVDEFCIFYRLRLSTRFMFQCSFPTRQSEHVCQTEAPRYIYRDTYIYIYIYV